MNRLPHNNIDKYLKQRLDEVLPPGVRSLLTQAARLASERGWRIYLVGGYVRDVLLRIPDYDIDISVEGDAIALADVVAPQAQAQLEAHDRFGTAHLRLG